MIRVRMTYSKRGRACFIPHIAIPPLLTRSAARAAVKFELTEGFSPRPKISLGPELSVGVPALAEPFEAWLSFWDENLPLRWSSRLPEGFTLTGAAVIDAPPGSEEAKPMGRRNLAASHLLALRASGEGALQAALERLCAGGRIHSFSKARGFQERFFRVIAVDPAQNGPGTLVRALAEDGVIGGWHEIFILREAVGLLKPPGNAEGAGVEHLVPQWPEGGRP